MLFISDAIAKQSNSLYPNGRAFAMPLPQGGGDDYITESGDPYITPSGDNYVVELPTPVGGILYRLHRALGVTEAQFWTDVRSIYDSILPDTNRFTADDATAWERRLKIYTANTDLATRKQAIQRKMNYPGSTAPRQSAVYLESQLRAAGFDVHVYENIFPDGMGGWLNMTPAEILGIPSGEATYGNFDYGQLDYGESYSNSSVTLIANYLEEDKDAVFDVGDSYASTFFIAGATLTTFANVPLVRKIEFRQLVLQIKPLQTVGFAFVNYI